jgi:hypothetical protein
MTKRFISVLIVVVFTSLFAGNLLAVTNATGAWSTIYKSGDFQKGEDSGHWRYGLYGDIRYYDRLGSINQYIVQPGIGYQLNKKFSIWGGYTYFRSDVNNKLTLHEHRTWQQLGWNLGNGWGASLKSRTRLEQRYRKNLDGTDLRLRQQLRIDRPLSSVPSLKFILGDEVFYHLADTTWTKQGYGQNRFYTGLGYNRHSFKMEALYMHQHIRIRYLPDLVNHLLVLNFKR